MSDVIEVVETDDDDVITVGYGASVQVVDVITAGPQGPAGPRGPAGTGGSGGGGTGFQFTQSTPATVWTIQHDLGFDPAGVAVVDSNGFFLDDFGVQYLIAGTTVRLSFDLSVGGTAYLS